MTRRSGTTRRTEPPQPQRRVVLESKTSYVLDVFTDPETRIKRALKDVIPILSDRKPQQGASGHFAPPLEGAWPD